MARRTLDRLVRLVAQICSMREVSAVTALTLGVLLATSVFSIGLLPFVAAESDFRVIRRAPGATDGDVFDSYGFTRRYHVYRELNARHPGAEFIMLEDGYIGRNVRQHLVAFSGAGTVCDADEATVLIASSSRVTALIERLEASEALQRWVGGDPRSESVHRIVASPSTTRFLVLADAESLDIIGVDLLEGLLDQRCDDRG